MEDIHSIEYQEEVPLTQWASIMIGLFIIVLTPTILLEALGVYKEPKTLLFFILLDAFFIIVLLNFRKLTIIIDSEYLVASFGLIRKRIKLSDIKSIESIDATLSVYTGMGIRYGGDGSLAYLPRLGDAVKLHFEDGRPFVFSTRNQEEVLEIIKKSKA